MERNEPESEKERKKSIERTRARCEQRKHSEINTERKRW